MLFRSVMLAMQILFHKNQEVMIRAIIAKDVHEFIASEPVKEVKKKASDIVPMDDLTDEDFDTMIKKQLEKV